MNDELRTRLALSEEKLSIRTHERDRLSVALVTSELELDEIHSEFSASAAKLAAVTKKLFERTKQLDERNKELAKKTEELQDSYNALNIQAHDRDCFVTVLQDLTNHIVGNTRILEYVVGGHASIGKQNELLKGLLGFNANLLAEIDRLRVAFEELSQQTAQLEKNNIDLASQSEALEDAGLKISAMKASMQQREDFIAALTHDLKNPLIGCSRILELISEGKISVEQHPDILLQMVESHKSMLNLIWNMMDVYRNDAGCLIPSNEAVDIKALIVQCVSEFTFAIKEKNIELIKEGLEGLPVFYSDRNLLRRVLMNLLDNAVKFTPQTGRIIVSAFCEDEKLRLSIKDSGEGMLPANCDLIFDRFWQAANGRQYTVGTGLGLFLAKQIVEVLGGSISCTSIEKIGTEFTVVLPVVRGLYP